MKGHTTLSAIIVALLISFTGTAQAEKEQTIYGSQLMTERERMEHRNRMRNAESQEERDKIRAEHHKRMQVRAKKQGVTLPATPPEDGKGLNRKNKNTKGNQGGMGKGMGSGMGDGMGGGRNKGNR